MCTNGVHCHRISHVTSGNKFKNVATSIIRTLFPALSDENLQLAINDCHNSDIDGFLLAKMVLQPCDYSMIASRFTNHRTWQHSRFAEGYGKLKGQHKKVLSCDNFCFTNINTEEKAQSSSSKKVILDVGFGAISLTKSQQKRYEDIIICQKVLEKYDIEQFTSINHLLTMEERTFLEVVIGKDFEQILSTCHQNLQWEKLNRSNRMSYYKKLQDKYGDTLAIMKIKNANHLEQNKTFLQNLFQFNYVCMKTFLRHLYHFMETRNVALSQHDRDVKRCSLAFIGKANVGKSMIGDLVASCMQVCSLAQNSAQFRKYPVNAFLYLVKGAPLKFDRSHISNAFRTYIFLTWRFAGTLKIRSP